MLYYVIAISQRQTSSHDPLVKEPVYVQNPCVCTVDTSVEISTVPDTSGFPAAAAASVTPIPFKNEFVYGL